jgi:hypothetical protein
MRNHHLLYLFSAGAIVGHGGCGSSDPAYDPSNDPGRITLHRLNNAEYTNTIRDLIGANIKLADFPTDERGYGFDNVADVLRLSPLSVELYVASAATIVETALKANGAGTTVSNELNGSSNTGNRDGDGWLFFSNDSIGVPYNAAAAGSYIIKVRAYGQQAGPDPAKLSIAVPGQAEVFLNVTATQGAPEVYQTTVNLAAGNNSIQVGFANDFFDANTQGDRNLWVDYVQITSVGGTGSSPGRDGILICQNLADKACQTTIVDAFTQRAWRRPITDAERAELLGLVDVASNAGDAPEEGIKLALQAALSSSNFLFRVEVDPNPKSRTPRPLTEYELASRLSYFLWSTMPDQQLFDLAKDKTLSKPDVLEAQVRRMIDDPKSVALIDNFAGQWLFTRALGDQDPDYSLFPEYDDELEASMRAETRNYFEEFLRKDVPMNQFLTADFTFVNDRLADFYGLPAVGSKDVKRVSLAGTNRTGFLTQASFLRITSRPKRTSPVIRGKWILDNLLCTPPRAPPPGVESLPDGMMATGSIRQRLEAHVKNPICASCHKSMDPLGFALDGFNAIGKARTEDQGSPVDTTGKLFNELPFSNAVDMAQLLAQEPLVYRCMVEKLYTYTGRSPVRVEALEHIDELTATFVAKNYSLRELFVAVATHASFTSRRGEP